MEQILTLGRQLRNELHLCPELAFQERKTKDILIRFLKEQTSLTVVDCGQWFYACYEASHARRVVGFRADYDAVEGADGQAGHYCGHDGHAATLATFGIMLCDMIESKDAISAEEDRRSDWWKYTNVYLIFQPAEEIGQGGALCSGLIEKKGIQEMYAFHNIPGYPIGKILLRRDTFACASTGLEIHLLGSPSHAAYPEAGRNPGLAMSRLICYADERVKQETKGMILATVIGMELGSKAYGVSASEGTLRLTVRGALQFEFQNLVQDLYEAVEKMASDYKLEYEITKVEPFPATENTLDCVAFLEQTAKDAGLDYAYLEEPFRWSEDFGYYLQKTKGAMFGVGAGLAHPELHTKTYEFPDEIMENVLSLYKNMIIPSNTTHNS